MSISPEYENLIKLLINDGYLKTPAIIEAFKAIDRVDFVPPEYKNDVYANAPLPIGFGQTISQPLTVAFMIELLQPNFGEKILDIGAGSGWVSAILAHLVSSKKSESFQSPDADKNLITSKKKNKDESIGKVIAIERIPELKEMAEKNIAKYDFIKRGIVDVILADGSKGYKKEAPYDKIIAGAAAKGETPTAWCQQLKIGGRIVAPVENSVITIDKKAKNKFDKQEHFGFSFVPLVEDADKRG